MRTIEEVRDKFLSHMNEALRRPGMCGGNAMGIELVMVDLFGMLLFIDDQESRWRPVWDHFLWGAARAYGQFRSQALPFPDHVSEVASIYAEVGFHLGYFRPSRLLTEGEMAQVAEEVRRESFRQIDHGESELVERFGPPSHEVIGSETSVACYACENPDVKWIFFDLTRRLPGTSPTGSYLADPFLRDFRDDVRNRLQLLPFGRRWADGEMSGG